MKGIVKWFDCEKGYGFICQEDGTDVFVHYTQIVQEGYKNLEAGDKVDYETKSVNKGLQACRVVKI